MYSNNVLKKTPLIAATILVISLAVVGPNSAAGSVARTATIAQGTITCPDKSTLNVGLAFNATETAQARYVFYNPSDGERSGDITKTRASQNSFQFIGIGEPVCSSASSDRTTISVQGKCGSDVRVSYKAKNGERGTFDHADVFCSK
jgi:hypothetical protein